VIAGLCLEQAQSLHPHELSGLFHLYCCLLTLGKRSPAPFHKCHTITSAHLMLILNYFSNHICMKSIIFYARGGSLFISSNCVIVEADVLVYLYKLDEGYCA
jgi:hypothetical protein